MAQSQSTPSTRETRGIELYRTRRREIWSIGPDLYREPSCTTETVYIVDYSAQTCSCPDYPRRGENCKRILAVGIAHAKCRPCGCAACYWGAVFLTYEEDGHEWTEPVPCRRCRA